MAVAGFEPAPPKRLVSLKNVKVRRPLTYKEISLLLYENRRRKSKTPNPQNKKIKTNKLPLKKMVRT